MIALNRLYISVLVGCLAIFSCNQKNISIEKQVLNIVDSLSMDEKYSNKLFVVQHQTKWNKSFIKISTAEFFNKDSATHYISSNGNLIIYYSNFFKNNKDKNENIDLYDNFAYKEETISIFHPRYIILEIDANGVLRNIVNDQDKNHLFQYGDRNVPEPIPSH